MRASSLSEIPRNLRFKQPPRAGGTRHEGQEGKNREKAREGGVADMRGRMGDLQNLNSPRGIRASERERGERARITSGGSGGDGYLLPAG